MTQFAQKTRASQQKDIEELEQIGKSLPAGTTGRAQGASGQQMMQRLEQASGASFDDEFVPHHGW